MRQTRKLVEGAIPTGVPWVTHGFSVVWWPRKVVPTLKRYPR
jgi:hypothetical protein